MASCEQAVYRVTERGLTRLDGDGDGVPYETLCRKAEPQARTADARLAVAHQKPVPVWERRRHYLDRIESISPTGDRF